VKGKTVIAVMASSSNDPWSAAANSTWAAIIQKAGAKFTLLQNPVSVTEQATQVNEAIAQHPNLLVINIYDTNEIIPLLEKAKAAGIPVLDWNAGLNATALKLVVSEINSNNTQQGAIAGQLMVQGLEKAGYTKANVLAETGTAASAIVQERMVAFKAQLAKHPGYKLVASEDANWNSVTAGTQATQVLSAWKAKGGIQGAFGMADYMALPIATDAKALGIPVGWTKPGDLVLVASNCTAAGAVAVKNGTLFGMADQLPIPQATIGANTALQFLAGKTVPKSIVTPVHEINQQNAAEYVKKCNY